MSLLVIQRDYEEEAKEGENEMTPDQIYFVSCSLPRNETKREGSKMINEPSQLAGHTAASTSLQLPCRPFLSSSPHFIGFSLKGISEAGQAVMDRGNTG